MAAPDPNLGPSLRSPEQQRPTKRETPVKRGRPAREARPVPVKPATSEFSSGKDSPAQDAVRAQLAKRPMTSADLVVAMQPDVKAGRISVSSIYAILSYMRKKGVVETKVEEADGERKNFLIE